MIRLGIILLFIVIGLCPLSIPRVSAQDVGEMRLVGGRVVNGTSGGNFVSDLLVVLHIKNMTVYEEIETKTDFDGYFYFDRIEYDPQIQYGVSVRYQGVLYGTDLDLSLGNPDPVQIFIYEAVTEETVLSVGKSSLLLPQVDNVGEMLYALEIVNVENDTDTTYVPGTDPMSLLRFGLPDRARDLRVDTRLMGADVLQVDRGFALTAPVPPGSHEVMFSYGFPYVGGQVALSRSLPYGAQSVRVLAPYGLMSIESEQLEGPEIVSIGDIPYVLFSGSGIERGERVFLDLSGIPQASWTEKARSWFGNARLEYAGPSALGVFMIVLIGFAIWRRSVLRKTDME